MLLNVASGVPEVGDNLRRELDMWDTTWYAPSNNDLTDQEIKAKAEEIARNKAEWLKKAKKKKWTDEMEKELIEEYKKKLGERVQ